MTAQNIHRTKHESNFVVLPNAILTNATLSGNAKALLSYLLSRPSHWKVRITDLQNVLKVGRDRVYRYLRELVAAGYASMTLVQKGVRWEFFDVPQTSQTPDTATPVHLTETQQAERQEALKKNEIPSLVSNEKTTTAELILDPVQETKIVVASVEIEQPTIAAPDPIIISEIERLPLAPKEKKVAVKTLSNLSLDECKMILAVYVTALTKGGIGNKIGYLVGLKKAAVNGTLSPVTTQQTETLSQRIARQERERIEDAKRGRVSNDEWAEAMIAKLGLEAFLKIAPWYTPQ